MPVSFLISGRSTRSFTLCVASSVGPALRKFPSGAGFVIAVFTKEWWLLLSAFSHLLTSHSACFDTLYYTVNLPFLVMLNNSFYVARVRIVLRILYPPDSLVSTCISWWCLWKSSWPHGMGLEVSALLLVVRRVCAALAINSSWSISALIFIISFSVLALYVAVVISQCFKAGGWIIDWDLS